MAILGSSYTTLLMSLAPPAPAKSSPAAGSLQLRSRQPAAASSVAALRWASCKDKESPSRAAVFACHAQKYTYNIERDVLLHIPTLSGDNWSVMEDRDHFILKFRVGESTSNEKLEVTTTEDLARLVIKYRVGGGGGDHKDASADDDNPASSLNVQLTMPPGYDGRNAKGMMSSNGWLIIAIPKPKHEARKIDISPPPSSSHQQ
ncbi:unnamed protein product [Miscanthus lutarioriparius]|uniref:SHSP domain-containing protein n=1 Tax=Miscanthus lutarioriparius TaxID=422564 RepID=A0A811QDB9_9POAL|nr:unnamed protein product [Miscanthus lutarioriparius]